MAGEAYVLNASSPYDIRFLITGGAGFIGSNLCETVLSLGHRVRCLDNFSTGKRENIIEFQSNSLFELMEGDIRDLDLCLTACESTDVVLHQAGWGSVSRSLAYPLEYEEVNIQGTLRIMEAARQQGVKRFILASSSSVYGDEPAQPRKEGREGKLLSPYALTKRVKEEYGRLYWELYGLPTISLRYFNVYGPKQNQNGPYAAVIPRFIEALLKGESPVIYGDGMQTRDFTYVTNVVQANLQAVQAPEATFGKTFNIACGEHIALLELLNIIARVLGKKNIQPVFGLERKGEIRHSHADIRRARQMIGYEPEWGLERGVEATVEWYKNRYGEENHG